MSTFPDVFFEALGDDGGNAAMRVLREAAFESGLDQEPSPRAQPFFSEGEWESSKTLVSLTFVEPDLCSVFCPHEVPRTRGFAESVFVKFAPIKLPRSVMSFSVPGGIFLVARRDKATFWRSGFPFLLMAAQSQIQLPFVFSTRIIPFECLLDNGSLSTPSGLLSVWSRSRPKTALSLPPLWRWRPVFLSAALPWISATVRRSLLQ
jgi:hypothetical protein